MNDKLARGRVMSTVDQNDFNCRLIAALEDPEVSAAILRVLATRLARRGEADLARALSPSRQLWPSMGPHD